MTELPINQKEYLKKYLGIGKAPGEKKKKKKRTTTNRVQIIDDDAEPTFSSNPINNEPIIIDEDAPQIVAIIDERPPSLRIDEKTNNPLWQPIGAIDDSGDLDQKPMIQSFKIEPKSNERQFLRPDGSPPRKKKKRRDESPSRSERDSSPVGDVVVKEEVMSENGSPPRNREEEDTSPPRRREDRNISPPRRRGDRNISPPRRREDRDNSPPRRRGDKDASPPRRRENKDMSPPRRREGKNMSPLRRRGEEDVSPPRRRGDKDMSPPRRRGNKDASPPRRREDKDTSPPRRSKDFDKNRGKVKYDEKRSGELNFDRSRSRSKYNSPPRRIKEERDVTPPRRSREPTTHRERPHSRFSDISPPGKNINPEISSTSREEPRRNKTPDISPPRKTSKEERNKKMEKTLDGKTAGLQNARELIEETKNSRSREDNLFNSLSKDVSGQNAESIFRDRRTGQIRNLAEEEEHQKKKREEEQKNKEKYARWGRGLAQVESREQQLQEQLHEMSKPLARYADDEDLEKYLKEQEREGDPMLAYIRKKKRRKAADAGEVLKPQFEGEFMPNRYGVRPGHRWDGVDRSSGYEKKWFEVQNEKKAQLEDSYKWSTEDM